MCINTFTTLNYLIWKGLNGINYILIILHIQNLNLEGAGRYRLQPAVDLSRSPLSPPLRSVSAQIHTKKTKDKFINQCCYLGSINLAYDTTTRIHMQKQNSNYHSGSNTSNPYGSNPNGVWDLKQTYRNSRRRRPAYGGAVTVAVAGDGAHKPPTRKPPTPPRNLQSPLETAMEKEMTIYTRRAK